MLETALCLVAGRSILEVQLPITQKEMIHNDRTSIAQKHMGKKDRIENSIDQLLLHMKPSISHEPNRLRCDICQQHFSRSQLT
jgi:hypothetical protein